MTRRTAVRPRLRLPAIPAGAHGDRHGRKGALLGGLGTFTLGCLTCALSGAVLGSFGVAALVFAVFGLHAVRAAHPLIDPRLFATPRLRAGVLGIGMAFFGLFALFFVNAQYLQFSRGYSPVLTGVAIGPLAVGMMATSQASVRLAGRFGGRTVITAGMVVISAGLALLSFTGPGTPYAVYAAYLVVMSLGMGLCVPALSTGVIGALPRDRAGLGSGLNGAAREVGSALGVAMVGTILTSRFTAHLPARIGRRRSLDRRVIVATDLMNRLLIDRLFVRGTVTRTSAPTPRTRKITISAPGLSWTPGQHVRVSADGLLTRRSYSVWAYDGSELDLCVLDHGDGPGARSSM